MHFDVEGALDLALALVTFALAAFLVWVRPRHGPTLALVCFLAMRGAWGLMRGLSRLVEDDGLAMYFGDVGGYFVRVLPITILYFASVFPVRRPWMQHEPWGTAAFLAAIFGIWVLEAIDPAVWAVGDDSGFARQIYFQLNVGFVLIALVYAIHALRHPDDALAPSTLLLSVGLLLIRLYDDTIVTLQRIAPPTDPDLRAWADPAAVLSDVLVVVLAAALVTVLARYAFAAPRPRAARAARAYLVAVVVCIGSGVAAYFLSGRGASEDDALGSVWNLAFPLLASYALVRHRLFGIDLKIKWTIKQSTIAAIFVAVFFAASETAQQLFSERVGPYVGIVAAGALVFAIHPLQHVAQRLSDKAMPGVHDPEELDAGQRLQWYREQLKLAWADGALSMDERKMLEATRVRLGLSAEQALAVEREIMGAGSP